MPGELSLLPFIESNFDPFAYSHAGATGLWQMMPGTASGYGININWWYDGRRDLVESTDKALNYMAYLGDFFDQDWLLAIAAYDSGEGNVLKAIKKQKKSLKHDFWNLKLPKETKFYIPKLLAIKEIIINPQAHNVVLPDIKNEAQFVIFNIEHQIDLNELAKLTEIDIKEVRRYNPGYRRNVTHPEMKNRILIPISNKNIASSHFHKIKSGRKKEPEFIRYRVKPGDTMSEIAQSFDSSTQAIKAANKLNSPLLIAGQSIIVPTNNMDKNKILRSPKLNTIITQDKLPGPRQKIHVVKAGETISTIAKQYSVTIGELEFWNKIHARNKLVLNQEIIIWKYSGSLKNKSYKVLHGDTLGKLSHKYNTSINDLRIINNLRNDRIIEGQTLRTS